MSKSKVVPAATLSVESEATNRILSRSSTVALIQTGALVDASDPPAHQMVISLFAAGKLLNFNRKSNDLIAQVLSRMRISCAKAFKELTRGPDSSAPPKKMQKGDSPISEPDIGFLNSTSEVLQEGTLREVVDQAVSLRIDGSVYKVVRDPPLVTSLEVESHLWAGFPVVALWSCSGAAEEEFTFEWRIIESETEAVVDTIHAGQVFTPSTEHLGKFLELRCFHPAFPEFYMSFSHGDRISEFPGPQQSRLTVPLNPTAADTIRVSTFNILAQPYLRTPLAQDVYYTHLHICWGITEWPRRLPLILREMLDTDSDIYCLQEVAGGSHETQLKRALASTHDWHFFGKASAANNGNPIGVSISLRRSRFEVVSDHRLNLGKGEDGLFQSMLTESERSAISTQFGEAFFGPVLNGLHTCAGVVHAKTIPEGRDVLVANTHLFFHPFGGHIRILQGLCLMRKLEEMRTALTVEGKPVPAIIVCGDFNSRPDSGSFKIMDSGKIEADHIDWQYGKSYKYEVYIQKEESNNETPLGEEDEAGTAVLTTGVELAPVKGIDVSHGLSIGHVPTEIPELTHATASFRSTLDYIFFSADCVEAVEGPGTGSSLPQFTNAEADRMGGLPFEYYGSDHVLVCGDVRLK
jgi:2',5'-phosphodiesterase